MSTTATHPLLHTRHPLSDDVRERMVDLLDARLADAVALGLQTKQAHWNVRGPHFLPLHELFDQVAAHAHAWADLLAERAGALGGLVDGTPATVAARSGLPEFPADLTDGEGHARQVAAGLAAFSAQVTAAIADAAEAGDPATEDLFTEIARAADQDLWFVEAHLQG